MANTIDLCERLGIPSPPNLNPDTISALLWVREVLQEHSKIAYSVRNPKGIDELRAIKIGDVDQWFHIRGRNRDNPILLYLHGGPGSTNIGWFDVIQRPWEDFFTVVQWDQRQCGKSYYPADDDNAPITIDGMIEDTEAVIKYLLSYLKQSKVFVLGHSWGSVLGMHIVKRHPDWLHAYIGLGQVVNLMKTEEVMHRRLLDLANEHGKTELVNRLEKILPYPDPDDIERSFFDNATYIRTELSYLSGETNMHYLPLDQLTKMINFDRATSPHIALTDISNLILGDGVAIDRSPNRLTKDFIEIDLPNDVGSSFDVPIFFFTGIHDWHTPRILSDEWFNQIVAPYKERVHFEDSCHYVVNEEPGRFFLALVNKVLPLAKTTNN